MAVDDREQNSESETAADAVEAFFDVIRESAPATVWSKGVALSRTRSVLADGRGRDGELYFRLRIAGQYVSPRVTLWMEDEDWHCNCREKDDPCVHVVASVAAMKNNLVNRDEIGVPLQNDSLPQDITVSAPPRLQYRLTRESGGLALCRFIINPTAADSARKNQLLTDRLTTFVSRRTVPTLAVTREDYAVDEALAGHNQGVLPQPIVAAVLSRLAHVGGVTLDGAAVECAGSLVAIRAVVLPENSKDGTPGFRLKLVREEELEEVFQNGAAMVAGRLRPLQMLDLPQPLKDRLRHKDGVFFSGDGLTDLVGDILPRLRVQMVIDGQRLLPPLVEAHLRPMIQVDHLVGAPEGQGQATVCARLYYVDATHQMPIAEVVLEHGREKLCLLAAATEGTKPGHGQSGVAGLLAIPERDLAEERTLSRRIQSELHLQAGVPVIMTARQLAQWQQELGSELESKWPLQDQTGTGLRLRGPLEVDISLDKEIDIQSADWAVRAVSQMQVQFRLAAGGRGAGMQTLAVSPEAVLKAWERGDRVVTLGAEVGGGFATIPTQWMDAHGDRLRRILAVRRQKLPQQEHGGRNENEGRRSAEFLDESSAESLKIDMLALAFEAGSPDTVLTTLSKFMSTGPESRPNNHADNQRYNQLSNVVLRPYQAEGVRWLAARKAAGLGALLADDMGLGKTLQALATITGPTLVVAPTSMLRTWVSEAARFRPDLELNLYHGPLRNLGPQASPVDSAPVDSAPVDSADAAARVRPSLTVTSYGVLRLDEEKLAAQHWHTVILDEAQNIRNADSQSARAARRLKADFRLALTGTPVENRAEDLWSLFQFILPGWLGSRQDALQTIQSQRQRKARLLPFILRRLKKDVAPELPPKTEQVITVELNEEERATYTAIQVATKAQALKYLSETNGEKVSPLGILEALLRLRQACCDPKLVLPPPGGIGARTASSKTKALLDQLESLTAEGHRALVFSQWTSYLDLIQGACAFKNIKTARLDGSTSVTKRAQLVDEFQNNPSSPPVMLMSLKAGGVGLTLTAADHVFIMDPWWNPAAEDQAADRAHRMGQNKPVFVYRMVAADTLEEAVIALQNKKRRLAEAALSGTDSEFTTDDLKAIIDSL